MENRFLEQSRAHGARVRPGHQTALSGAQSWATALAASDRALLILVENGGVDLGIPDLVDALLEQLPGSSMVPDSLRASLVKAIEDKVKEYTDTLLETAELTVNAYESAKPGLYGEIVVLRNGAATLTELKTQLQALTRQRKLIDVYVLTHGSTNSIAAHGDMSVTGDDIRAIKTNLGRPLSIRSVYMMNCVGSTLNQAWLDAGAKCSSGSIGNNYVPEPTMHLFWEKWKAGQTFENAVLGAYGDTVNLMNRLVRDVVKAIPIVGPDLASSIDFSTFGFVRDSAPVVQGQRGLTISSDALAFSMSRAPSLATTVLPAGLLRTLSEPDRGGRPARTVSDAAIELIKSFESLRTQMYNDPVGHCTIGYGTLLHTGNCDGRPAEESYKRGITEAEATDLLRRRAAEFQEIVNDRVSVPLNQNQNDALVSFVYNIGGQAFGSSTLLRLLNEGKYDQVPAELRKWTKAHQNGHVVELPGLVRRRAAEAELFAKPAQAAAQAFSLRAGAMGAVDYTVPRLVAPLREEAPMTGWATVIAMMDSWRQQQSVPVETVLAQAGQEWVERYHRGEDLDVKLARRLYDAVGLISVTFENPTIEHWDQLLRSYGPLYVDVDVDAGPTPTHPLIVTGIHGDGTATGTTMTFIDPGTGQVVDQRFDAFLERYEAPSAVNRALVITHWPAGATAGQSLPIRHAHSYQAPSTAQTVAMLAAQMNPVVIAGITVADAAQIGLGAVSVVQAGASASSGSFSLTFDKAQRLLTAEARAAMPGAQAAKSKHAALIFAISIGAINAANADVIVEWEGNDYGEVSTPIFRKRLETSTDWSRSSANIAITKLDTIPPANTDPRAWPIVYHYEGTYDPYGNGLFEFTGEFEINAFGGLKFNKHQVVSRSAMDFAIGGSPEDKVARGRDVSVSVPAIPQEQVDYLRTRLP